MSFLRLVWMRVQPARFGRGLLFNADGASTVLPVTVLRLRRPDNALLEPRFPFSFSDTRAALSVLFVLCHHLSHQPTRLSIIQLPSQGQHGFFMKLSQSISHRFRSLLCILSGPLSASAAMGLSLTLTVF